MGVYGVLMRGLPSHRWSGYLQLAHRIEDEEESADLPLV